MRFLVSQCCTDTVSFNEVVQVIKKCQYEVTVFCSTTVETTDVLYFQFILVCQFAEAMWNQ